MSGSDSDSHNSYEEDDEEIPLSSVNKEYNGYTFIVETFPHELDGVHEIRGKLKHKNDEVGSLLGYLIFRDWHSNFYELCDSVSGELQLLSNVLFHTNGRLRRDIWENRVDKDLLIGGSSGKFLNIDYVEVRNGHRKKELGFHFLDFLLKSLTWNISVIQPGLTNHDLDVIGDAKKEKENHVCQLFSRLGYKFLQIESSEPYWYLFPNMLTTKSKEEVKNVKWEFIGNEHFNNYQNEISRVHSMACFEEALVCGLEMLRKRPKSVADAISKYKRCLTLMPAEQKSLLIDGVISPRMFSQLSYAASNLLDITEGEVEGIKQFPNRQKIMKDDLEYSMSMLLDCFPEEVVSDGVYKSFVTGAVKILDVISTCMSMRKLPTLSQLMRNLSSSWPPSHIHFFENGGKVEHLFNGIFRFAKDRSWSHGDGTYYFDAMEIGDDSLSLPIVWYFDEDFHYVETYLLKHILES